MSAHLQVYRHHASIGPAQVWNAIAEYCNEATKDAFKYVSQIPTWINILIPNNAYSKQLSAVSTLGTTSKNAWSFSKVPLKLQKTAIAVSQFAARPSVHNGRAILREGSACINNLCEGIFLFSAVWPIGGVALQGIKGIHSLFTFLGCSHGAVETLEKMAAEKGATFEKQTWQMINVARDTSFAVLGVLGAMVALSEGLKLLKIATLLTTAYVFAPYELLSLASLGLLCSTAGSLMKKLVVDPQEKFLTLPSGRRRLI